MSARYAPLPNPRTDPLSNPELDAAFDGSDDEEADESHPLNAISSPSLASPSRSVAPPDCRAQQPSAYDFDSPIPDYDRPPPGSPPPSAHPLPTTPTVNPNGVFTPNNVLRRPTSWWKRASAVLPTLYVPWFGVNVSEPRGRLMGGGTANDGVFKNMSAKPTGSRTRVPAGDSIYVVPEETSSVPPPSYAAAQADAVPPYHTSTLLLPSHDGPLSQGSVIVDALPTGTLFVFLWNTLISTTFQFIGFVLTWVMSTTHAARYGSRAGLGITLIQWGLGLRARLSDPAAWEDPTFATAKEAEEYYQSLGFFNASSPALPPTIAQPQSTAPVDSQTDQSTWSGDALLSGPVAADWLSFLLMVCGWYLLLMSSLGFWRVKRWETSILGPATTSSDSRLSPPQAHVTPPADSEPDEANPRTSFLAPFLYMPRQQDDHGENGDPEGQDQGGDSERSRRWRAALVRNRAILEELRSGGYL